MPCNYLFTPCKKISCWIDESRRAAERVVGEFQGKIFIVSCLWHLICDSTYHWIDSSSYHLFCDSVLFFIESFFVAGRLAGAAKQKREVRAYWKLLQVRLSFSLSLCIRSYISHTTASMLLSCTISDSDHRMGTFGAVADMWANDSSCFCCYCLEIVTTRLGLPLGRPPIHDGCKDSIPQCTIHAFWSLYLVSVSRSASSDFASDWAVLPPTMGLGLDITLDNFS